MGAVKKKVLDKVKELREMKKNRVGVQVWMTPQEHEVFRKKLKEDQLTAQEVLMATVDLFLEEE